MWLVSVTDELESQFVYGADLSMDLSMTTMMWYHE